MLVIIVAPLNIDSKRNKYAHVGLGLMCYTDLCSLYIPTSDYLQNPVCSGNSEELYSMVVVLHLKSGSINWPCPRNPPTHPPQKKKQLKS